MLRLPLADACFDIVWAWGTVHHTTNPLAAVSELLRVLKPGGSILLAIYKKTRVTFIHEIIRKTLIRTPRWSWTTLSKVMAVFLAPVVFLFKKREKSRKGEKLEELILDWYFVPIRHHYRPEEIETLPQGPRLESGEVPSRLGPLRQFFEFHLQGAQTSQFLEFLPRRKAGRGCPKRPCEGLAFTRRPWRKPGFRAPRMSELDVDIIPLFIGNKRCEERQASLRVPQAPRRTPSERREKPERERGHLGRPPHTEWALFRRRLAAVPNLFDPAAGDHAVFGQGMGDHRPGAHHRAPADGDAVQDDDARAQPDILADVDPSLG